MVTGVPNEQTLVLRVRFDEARIPRSYFTDALGETMRSFAGFRINDGEPLIEADELRGPETGDFDWSFNMEVMA